MSVIDSVKKIKDEEKKKAAEREATRKREEAFLDSLKKKGKQTVNKVAKELRELGFTVTKTKGHFSPDIYAVKQDGSKLFEMYYRIETHEVHYSDECASDETNVVYYVGSRSFYNLEEEVADRIKGYIKL